MQCERELFEDVRHVLHHPKGLADGCRALEDIPEVGPAVGSGSIAEYQLEVGPVLDEFQCDLPVQPWAVLLLKMHKGDSPVRCKTSSRRPRFTRQN